MKKLFFCVAVVAALVFFLWPQFASFAHTGVRRFNALHKPAKEIVVGVCWPFSVSRDGMADGLQLALDEINSGNLAGGHTIRLVMRDDNFNWNKSRRIALDFAHMPDMSAMIGYYYSTNAVRASPIFESSRLLHIVVGANNTAMTSHGFQYLARTILSSDKIARSLAKFTTDRGYRKIALLWEEGAYGEDLAHHYRVSLDDLNAQVVYQWSYIPARADFRLPVNELKGIDADAIFFVGLEARVGDFLRTARGVGLKTPIIIGDPINNPDILKRAGQALEGAMYYDFYNVDSPSPINQAFVRKFRSRYGKNPDTWAAQGYDALHILAKAAKFTGSRNSLDLSYAIRYMDAWEGANGRYKFNSDGELEDKPIFLKMFQNGKSVTILGSEPVSKPAP